MSRMRVIFDNAAYRATLAASSAAGTRTVDRLLTNMKTDVWRATGTAATLTLTWPTPEIIGGVALPFCNITSAATIRVRGYTLPDDAAPAVDSGAILAAPPAPLDGGWWGVEALAPNIYRRGGANTFAQGGGAYARAWIAHTPMRKLVVDLDDAANPDGHIEAGRIIVGRYWQPDHNHSWGAKVGLRDGSRHARGGGGDQFVDAQARGRSLSIDLSWMTPHDRTMCWSILRDYGLQGQVLVSLYPDDPDPREEQMHMLFGRLSADSAMTHRYLGVHQTSLTLEES